MSSITRLASAAAALLALTLADAAVRPAAAQCEGVACENGSVNSTTCACECPDLRELNAGGDACDCVHIPCVAGFRQSSCACSYQDFSSLFGFAGDAETIPGPGAAGLGSLHALAVADLDGDNIPDVLAASRAGGRVAWFKGDQYGDHTEAIAVGNGSRVAAPAAVAVGTLGTSAHPDAVVLSRGGLGLEGFANPRGNGTFDAAATLAAGVDDVAWRLLLADVDGDGDTDILLHSPEVDRVVWFANVNGTGTFGAAQNVTAGGNPNGAAVADVDGDGRPDVVLASDAGGCAWLRSLGGGSFGAAARLSPAGVAASAVHAIDYDQDGDTDVFCALEDAASSDGAYRADLFENEGGAAAFTTYSVWPATASALTHFQVVDMDNDGDQDLVAVVGAASVRWRENTGSRDFANERTATSPAGGLAHVDTMLAVDVDGDGDADVVLLDADGGTVEWVANEFACKPGESGGAGC